jgi:hypothetical protein
MDVALRTVFSMSSSTITQPVEAGYLRIAVKALVIQPDIE